MAKLSNEQLELKNSIQKSAVIWSVILALVIALLAYWLLSSQGAVVRLGLAALIAAASGYGIFRAIFSSKAKSAKCQQCSAAFSTSLDDRNEVLVDSQQRSESEPLDGGRVKVTRWVEEKYDVVDSYKCSNCGFVSTKEYQVSRKRDEISKIDAPLGRTEKGGAPTKPAKTSSAKPPKSTSGKPSAKSGTKPGAKSKTTKRRPSRS